MKKSRALLLTAALAGAAALPLPSFAQTWVYQTYETGGKMGSPGNIVLTDQGGGDYSFKMMARNLDECWNSSMQATVTRTDTTTTIETVPSYQGCKPVRFVVKNDGSGGERQNLTQSGSWKPDSRDRGLTLKQ